MTFGYVIYVSRIRLVKNPLIWYYHSLDTRHSQVSAWQPATLLPIRCKAAQPVPARVEELESPERQSSSVGTTNNLPFYKMS